MKVVIADTSPLNYLVLIDSVNILPRLYGTVLAPAEVIAELVAPGTPPPVKVWIQNRPDWLHVTSVPHSGETSLDQLETAVNVPRSFWLKRRPVRFSSSLMTLRVAGSRTREVLQPLERSACFGRPLKKI